MDLGAKVKIDTLTLKFNDSQFEIESLEHIKFLEVEQSIDLKEKINKTMKELKNDDTMSAKYVRSLFDYHTIAEEIFFQKYNTTVNFTNILPPKTLFAFHPFH